jgi:hypothetical protein
MRHRAGRWLVLLSLLLLVGATPLPQPPAWRAEATDLRVERAGNMLVARREVTVAYDTLDRLLVGIESREASRPAIRLVREAPGQLIDYYFCVTADGRLVVGQQVWRRHPGSAGYAFERAELARAYSPLEDNGTWTWLLDISVARETEVTLVARADGDQWPVRHVSLTVLRSP